MTASNCNYDWPDDVRSVDLSYIYFQSEVMMRFDTRVKKRQICKAYVKNEEARTRTRTGCY